MFIVSGWMGLGNGLLWWAGADCVFDWQAAIFLRFGDLGSFTYPCKQTLTSEIFGTWPQYFYTVIIHTFITQSFMNSEGLLHCTQTSFNLFSWSNTLKQSWRSLYNQGSWFTLFCTSIAEEPLAWMLVVSRCFLEPWGNLPSYLNVFSWGL